MADRDVAYKALSDFEIKDAEHGEVTAVVSVFNVVDRDGDVILPGAIKDGTVVKLSSYAHSIVTEGAPPAGKGVVRVDGERAVFHGKYFMSTTRGAEAFAVVKELGAGGSEWSIGYPRDVRTAKMTDEWRTKGATRLIAGLDLLEVSPVFLGANQYTATVGTKEQAAAEEPTPEAVEAERVRAEAETKAAADAEAARVAREAEDRRVIAEMVAQRMTELKAAREAEVAAADKARLAELAAKEFERFERTRRRLGVG